MERDLRRVSKVEAQARWTDEFARNDRRDVSAGGRLMRFWGEND